MTPKPARFVEGERVLCFHGPLIYEAKCLKSQIKDKQVKYFIHYNGWNKNWDEWVPESRVLKFSEANIQKQKELLKSHVKSKKAKTLKKDVPIKKDNDKEPIPVVVLDKPSKPKVEKKVPVPPAPVEVEQPKVIQEEVKKKKVIGQKQFIEEEENSLIVKIDFPQPLRDWLIDDWDLVTRQDMLLNLPARVTVDHVICNYVKEKVSVKGVPQSVENTVVQFANRIRDCFNILLGKLLLYPFERQQYSDMLSEYSGWSMCQLYGAIHLLRMLTKLEPLIAPLSIKVNDNSSLATLLNDFTVYMSRNFNFFSLDDYIVASPAYHRIG